MKNVHECLKYEYEISILLEKLTQIFELMSIGIKRDLKFEIEYLESEFME